MTNTEKECECIRVQPFRSVMRTYSGVQNATTETVVDNNKKTIEVRLKPQQYNSKFEFPNIGDSSVEYIDKTANRVYRWDDTALTYYCVGSDYNEIKVINGGNANGN